MIRRTIQHAWYSYDVESSQLLMQAQRLQALAQALRLIGEEECKNTGPAIVLIATAVERHSKVLAFAGAGWALI